MPCNSEEPAIRHYCTQHDAFYCEDGIVTCHLCEDHKLVIDAHRRITAMQEFLTTTQNYKGPQDA